MTSGSPYHFHACIRPDLPSKRLYSLVCICLFLILPDPVAATRFLTDSTDVIQEEITLIEEELEGLPQAFPSGMPWTHGFCSNWNIKPGEDVTIQVDFPTGPAWIDEVILMPKIHTNEANSLEAHCFPIRFVIERILPDGSSDIIVDHRDKDYEILGYEPQRFPLESPKPATGIRIITTKHVTGPMWKAKTPVVMLGEVFVFAGEKNVALNSKVTASSAFIFGHVWGRKALVDGFFAFSPTNRKLSDPRDEFHIFADEVILEFDLGEIRKLDEFRVWPVIEHDFPAASGTSFPTRIKLEAIPEGETEYSRVIHGGNSIGSRPGASPFMHIIRDVATRHVRFTLDRSLADFRINRPGKVAISEIQLLSNGNVLTNGLIPKVSTSRENRASEYKAPGKLTDGRTNEGDIISLRQWVVQSQRRAQIERHLEKLQVDLKIARHRKSERASFFIISAIAIIIILTLLIYVVRLLGQRRLNRMRIQIAGDLHDEVGANLSSIAHATELVGETISQPTDKQGQLLGYAMDTARKSARDIRQIVEFLEHRYPMDSVTEQIGKIAKEILVDIPLTYTIKEEALFNKLSPVSKWNLMLFVKESANNILKHANATEVTITTTRTGKSPCLVIEDNGLGFPVGSTPPQHLESRTKQLGGKLNVKTVSGQGTRITLTL